MTAEELCARVEAMPPGAVEVLTQAQFDGTFAREPTLDGRKRAALALGERCGCAVVFVGSESMFVRFTRRQDQAA